MNPRYLILCISLALAIANGAPLVAQQRIVELEIQCDPRAVVGTQQQWMEALQDVGADRVVVKTSGSDQPKLEETQLSSGILISVTGTIDGRRLLLPGGSFAITNKTGIRDWISRLRDDGAQVALAEKKAFGLTSEQLVGLHETLATPVSFPTMGIAPQAAIEKIAASLPLSVSLDAGAQAALRTAEPLGEEFQGMASGTSLAAIIRPSGLVLEPRRHQGKAVELWIVETAASREYWPVGWPLEKPPVQVEPKLFETIELEIRGFPLKDALHAIEKRTGVPFFYDQNSMARAGIELSTTKVTVVQKKISFMVAIGKLLRQSKPRLIEELRMDEKGTPFLWISTP